jgi:hypothetical protein
MSGAVAIADRLSRVLTRLDGIEDVDVAWLASAVRTWLSGEAWDTSLELAPGWREVLLHRQRQRAMQALLASLPPMPCRAAAREIAGLLRSYETTAWPTDRASLRRPDGARGVAFDYLSAGGATSPERLRKLIEPGSPKASR